MRNTTLFEGYWFGASASYLVFLHKPYLSVGSLNTEVGSSIAYLKSIMIGTSLPENFILVMKIIADKDFVALRRHLPPFLNGQK